MIQGLTGRQNASLGTTDDTLGGGLAAHLGLGSSAWEMKGGDSRATRYLKNSPM